MQNGGDTSEANNRILITSNGALLVLLSGHQKRESIHDLNEQLSRYITTMRYEHKPIPVLMDLTRVLGRDEGAEQEAAKLLNLDFDALAVYNAKPDVIKQINKVVTNANQKGRVRTFNAIPEATRWLANFLVINAAV